MKLLTLLLWLSSCLFYSTHAYGWAYPFHYIFNIPASESEEQGPETSQPEGKRSEASAAREEHLADGRIAMEAPDSCQGGVEAAIKEGKLSLMYKLLAKGAQDPCGFALFAAIQKGDTLIGWLLGIHRVLVDDLLKHGAQDPFGIALEAAIERNYGAIVEKLLKHGAKDPFRRALEAAINQGDDALANKLLETGVSTADVNGEALTGF